LLLLRLSTQLVRAFHWHDFAVPAAPTEPLHAWRRNGVRCVAERPGSSRARRGAA